MNITIIDEDREHVPHICELLRAHQHVVKQVYDWRTIPDKVKLDDADLIILDIMMPNWKIAPAESASGFATGRYVYTRHIKPHYPLVPFLILSAADFDVSVISEAIAMLEAEPSCKGVFRKDDLESLVARLSSMRTT